MSELTKAEMTDGLSPQADAGESTLRTLRLAIHLESAAISPQTSSLIEAAKDAASLIERQAAEIYRLKRMEDARNSKPDFEKLWDEAQAEIERQAADLACKEIAFDRQAETLRLSLKNEADLEAEIERLHSLINETHQKCSAEQDPHHSQ